MGGVSNWICCADGLSPSEYDLGGYKTHYYYGAWERT
ncbi:hypothetical protein ABIB80_007438 [Bradyrhizobium sp. i1.15.2]